MEDKKNKDHPYLPKYWPACPVEEEYFGQDRKADKQYRKQMTAKDRSQYKKTDRSKMEKIREDQKQQKLEKKTLYRGRDHNFDYDSSS